MGDSESLKTVISFIQHSIYNTIHGESGVDHYQTDTRFNDFQHQARHDEECSGATEDSRSFVFRKKRGNVSSSESR